ncbi:phosphoglucosamine mutase [Oleiphilus sp. HI0009]|uniref:phosphoglucosamine mutase n=1 Tax=unclassified Oleiphilus TaxID=2631174 RepID=UPI0007C3C19B|nr:MULTISPECIES: phosphoglucosamine mutase [unclassified Oleiphilus]KZX80535.1 phosphoglucosamine mutase [Oleiphilus sp. HI0009]MCH2157307.1 phosphoglucosamine mutase [Oleiphilaceae bacterium]KZY67100.1 phosphoglucosamine mutase [Oleiphilus sp. HI0066]KZY73917.1 phosphoglucosamine mutase [Oleiphilus sp. HI0067]KZZ56847.1 phosphoglucosamine mutase [Oleiphilus sp. HI0125]
MADRKYFGTDGIRGRLGEGAITPEFMLKLGWACGQVFKKQGTKNKVIIGKDTRISGYLFEAALEAGLSAAGVGVRLIGPMPTPAVAYLTRTYRANAGIVISASHNPYQDNGIKFFSSEGMKLDDDIELEIESWLDKDLEVVPPAELGKAKRIDDAVGRYVEYCKSTIPNKMDLEGMDIVLDCAHGSTYQVAPYVFRELGANVTAIGVEPDGLNINRGFGSTSPEALVAKVKELNADLGIAFDGDGDRVVMVTGEGQIVDGDELIFIISKDRIDQGAMDGGVVGTQMTNFGVEVAFNEAGIPFTRAKVGDRYVMEQLKEKGWLLGGEGSGHLICFDKSTTGDGIVSALQVLHAMWRRKMSLSDLAGEMTKLPQVLKNVKVAERCNPLDNEIVATAVTQQEARFEGRGRVLLRASGTEPLIRVMAEGEDSALVNDVVDQLVSVVTENLA